MLAAPDLRPDEKEALAFLMPLSHDYPDIDRWFRLKVVPGLRTGTRTLVCIERGGVIVGVGIGKHESGERKICTVRVTPSYFGRGVGLRLFDKLLTWLQTDQPHLTVSELKLPAFERIFDRYGFKYSSSHTGLYVSGVTELHYNDVTNEAYAGSISRTAASISNPAMTDAVINGTSNFSL